MLGSSKTQLVCAPLILFPATIDIGGGKLRLVRDKQDYQWNDSLLDELLAGSDEVGAFKQSVEALLNDQRTTNISDFLSTFECINNQTDSLSLKHVDSRNLKRVIDPKRLSLISGRAAFFLLNPRSTQGLSLIHI